MQKNTAEQKGNTDSGLVGAEELLEILFKDERSRPSLRWMRTLQSKRLIPYRKINRRVFFCPVEVRRALDTQFTVKRKGE